MRTYSDKERKRPIQKLCALQKRAASELGRESELSGNKSVYPVRTFLFRREEVPGFISVKGVLYTVIQTPLNAGTQIPESIGAFLIHANSKLIYACIESHHQSLSCLYFD